MNPEVLPLLVGGAFSIALLYSSVGHAGASGYIAVMTLLGLAPTEIRPLSLALNILVASIATWHFARAGKFSWSLFWPFALLAVPAAFVGGQITLPNSYLRMLLGAILLVSAAQLLLKPPAEREPRALSLPVALVVGAVIGLVAGLVGTGGGIFLTPLLLFAGWARAGIASGVSAPFILVNSIAGLAGNVAAAASLPAGVGCLAAAVVVGGWIGAYFGSTRLPAPAIKRLLALVLAIAGGKMVLP